MKRSARLRAPTVGNGSYSPLPAAWASTGAARTAHIRTLASPTPNRVIAARTIQTRPLALAGAAAVVVEALIALLGGHAPLLAAIVLLVAPGLALLPLLPERARRDLVTALAAAPALGFVASSVALITVASIGLSLDGLVIRLVEAALVAAGLLLAVLAGVILEGRVIRGSPVPGNDWAKYVLYADEIRNHKSLLID